ncbi:hypothetical protein [Salinicola endophyticus]|nr:hypothetical protein [Salinicola endophyticus]
MTPNPAIHAAAAADLFGGVVAYAGFGFGYGYWFRTGVPVGRST